ncbi:hypothetical protein [Ammoniphilus sp. CFH 90114]|uniref:hypothetical protein n=1 Tax=Ammoniphilus sp. CFH 90114 TaxID=2493665 RepID=UPI00100F66D3|nr:hypothetical protein [Ammoniphilus sp. CFH 90114]RXT04863.1 hypothetical protein EIZ39_19255 [Ammoniphilus sp. CFH 90114]
MFEERYMGELEDVPLKDWTLTELAFHHHVMAQMGGFLNTEGVSFHHTIINEIERRGGLQDLHLS